MCNRNIGGIIAILGLLGFSHAASAQSSDDWLITVGFASGSPLLNDNSERGNYVPLWLAKPEAFDRQVGGYISVGIPETDFAGNSSSDRHTVRVLNAGFTFKPSNNVVLYAGPGYSYQREHGFNVETRSKHRLNANLGVAFVGRNFGVNFGYDSGPNAFGIGFVVTSYWFGGRF